VSFATSNTVLNANPDEQENAILCIFMQPTATMTLAIRPLAYSAFVLNATAGMTTNTVLVCNKPTQSG